MEPDADMVDFAIRKRKVRKPLQKRQGMSGYQNAPAGPLPGRLGCCARSGLKYVVVFQQQGLSPADALAQLAVW